MTQRACSPLQLVVQLAVPSDLDAATRIDALVTRGQAAVHELLLALGDPQLLVLDYAAAPPNAAGAAT